MKSLHIVLLCFLITVLYLSSHNISSSAPSTLPGRQPRKLSMSFINKKHDETPKIKIHLSLCSSVREKSSTRLCYVQVIDGESETPMVQENPVSNKYGSSNDNIEDIVYQIDYHGVTTHPTPTPRHSKP